jgi:DNA-binding transcriptional regulator YiaG
MTKREKPWERGWEELTTSGKSLIKIIKNKGPNMDPWGTPEDIGSQSE